MSSERRGSKNNIFIKIYNMKKNKNENNELEKENEN